MKTRLDAKKAEEEDATAVDQELEVATAAVETGIETAVMDEVETAAIPETSSMVKIFVILFFIILFFCFFLFLLHVVIFVFELRECHDGMLKKFGR